MLANSDIVLAIAAECADVLLITEERDKFLQALKVFPDSDALIAVYEFIVEMNQNSLKRPEAIERLYGVYKTGNKHDQLLSQLYNGLNPNEDDEAIKIIEVSEDILSKRDLIDSEYARLCQAKATKYWKGKSL